MFSRVSAKVIIFLQLKKKFHRSYVPELFTNFSVVSAMLPINSKTKRHFMVRMCEHLGTFPVNGGRVTGDNGSAIKGHLLVCNIAHDFEDFSNLAAKNNDFKVTLMESVLINTGRSSLNKNNQVCLWSFLVAGEQSFIT